MKTVIITGGTGSIGTALTRLLQERGYRVIIFTRRAAGRDSGSENVGYARWYPSNLEYDADAVRGADAIINLAGAGIANGRWTKARMDEIYNSRINAGKTLVKALTETPNKVQVVVNASAIGFYGRSDGVRAFREEDPPGTGFLPHVCHDWEDAMMHISTRGTRVIILRTGMVLDANSGGYPKMTAPLRFRIGAVPGTGREIVSWIHMDDLCRLYLYALENESLSGIFNACAPVPVTGEIFIREAALKKLGRGFLIVRTPAGLLRLVLGKVVDEAILQNARVSAGKILRAGFGFQYPTIKSAIAQLEG